jgi:hypothetical protein
MYPRKVKSVLTGYTRRRLQEYSKCGLLQKKFWLQAKLYKIIL